MQLQLLKLLHNCKEFVYIININTGVYNGGTEMLIKERGGEAEIEFAHFLAYEREVQKGWSKPSHIINFILHLR